eukprot:9874710-Karenia_brevis.AAC.1
MRACNKQRSCGSLQNAVDARVSPHFQYLKSILKQLECTSLPSHFGMFGFLFSIVLGSLRAG